MTCAIAVRRRLLFVALVLVLYAVELPILYHLAPEAGRLPALPLAPVVDLLLLPLLLYGLMFGWHGLTRGADWLPLAAAAAGLAALRVAVPPATRLPGPWLEGVLVTAELLLLLRLLATARRAQAAYRRHRSRSEGVYESVQAALAEALPPAAARWLALEVSVAMTLVGFRRIAAAEAGGITFGYLRRGAAGAVYGALGLLAAVETAAVHILLVQWLPSRWHPAIWAMTILSGYALLWLAADYLAMKARPHRIAGGFLYLRLGFRTGLAAPLEAIAAAGPYRPPAPAFTPAERARLARERVPALAPAATECNVLLSFDRPLTLGGPLGRPRPVTRLALAVDEPERFVAELRRARSAPGT